MKPKAWKQITLIAPAHTHDLLIGSLTAIGFNGFLQEEETLAAFIERRYWDKRLEAALQRLVDRVRVQFPAIGARFLQRDLKEKNWNAVWERSAGIVEATNRIIIKPSWKKLRKKDRGKIVLHIDPKMSFGTGHHETTRLCLSLLERHLSPGVSVLDVGTGTGVLAIAARKLGARRVLALDIDRWSIENAKENVKRNGVAPYVSVRQDGVDKPLKRRFHLVLANLDYPTISRSLSKLLASVSPGGTIILSGLLTSDLPSFLQLLEQSSAVPVEVVAENEWIALALIKLDGAPDNAKRRAGMRKKS
ncbi:MAG TPA: 50S ribosomal protein L11 methyltransferase [Bacteroidota bacterium]|nr:50S ribosomal protein L11 methyltransferase [Bacteroidota bacterium]